MLGTGLEHRGHAQQALPADAGRRTCLEKRRETPRPIPVRSQGPRGRYDRLVRWNELRVGGQIRGGGTGQVAAASQYSNDGSPSSWAMSCAPRSAGRQGVEGGFWQSAKGPRAHAFPTYEGTGPKTDLPAAELPTIWKANLDALRTERPVTIRQSGASRVLVILASRWRARSPTSPPGR
jgi:hypothetical protein